MLTILAAAVTISADRPSNPVLPVSQGDLISDHPELIVAHHQSWGRLGLDTCAHATEQTPLALRIGTKRYEKGLGTHANGEVVLDLGGAYVRFEAEIGVQWQQGTTGSVVFAIVADEAALYTSPILHEWGPAVPVSVSVAGCDELRLIAKDAGDGITCDCADWAEARLVRAAETTRAVPKVCVDIAPFAQVRSWNWHELEGTHAGRLDEFPAADLFPWTQPSCDQSGAHLIAAQDGFACIGLEWLEPRRIARLELEFDRRTNAIATSLAEARVEQWIAGAGGGSTWQGHWARIHGDIREQNHRWVLEPSVRDDPAPLAGTTKIRWIVPAAASPDLPEDVVRVLGLHAFTRSRWQQVELVLAVDPPRAGARAMIEIYNGTIQNRDVTPGRTDPLAWDLAAPLRIVLTACASRQARGDRTVLHLRMPDLSFGVAVEDVLAPGGVWVADADLYVSGARKPVSLAEYRRSIARQHTVLDEVRARPDQTLDTAMARLHRPEQDLGPTLISLPADNRKFIVARDGTVSWDDRPEIYDGVDRPPSEPYRCAAVVRFGERSEPATERELVDPSCFALELRRSDGAIHYSLQAFVTTPATGELDLVAENTGSETTPAAFDIRFVHPAGVHIRVAPDRNAATVATESGTFAWVMSADGPAIESTGDRCVVRGQLAPHARSRVRVVLPRWNATAVDLERLPDAVAARVNAQRAWHSFTFEMAAISLPDPALDRIFHASVLHCLAAARTAKGPRDDPQAAPRIAPWIASVSYGPLESEAQSVIRGMQALGARSFAAAAHRYFADRIDANGRLTTGYTLIGTGWHLWTLGEYDQLFADDESLRALAPSIVRACHWITTQRRKTMRVGAHGEKLPAYGLMPPGPLADWDVYAFYSYANANYCAGLRDVAAALARIHDPNAPEIAADADAFRDDLLRALHFAQARAPVVLLRDGRWVPFAPTQVDSHGAITELYPDQDAGRSWCYDVEVGASQLLALGLLDPRSREAGWIVDHNEDDEFLRGGWFAYSQAENLRDPFARGGFAKVQPYYARTVETHALRDDVAPFLRSYFNTIPTLLDREDLSLWEHFAANGAWNKTHETGYFLYQTRTLLLAERGTELWLAPFVPRAWLEDGKHIDVSHAPTRFGPISYRIESHVSDRHIDVTIDPPQRSTPSALVLRLRHPDGTRIRSVTADGRTVDTIDAEAGLIRLPGAAHAFVVSVSY